MKWFFITILGLPLFFSCHNKTSQESTARDELAIDIVTPVEVVEESPDTLISALSDTSFLFLATLSGDFVYDMKYATADNFLKTRVFLRSMFNPQRSSRRIDQSQRLIDATRV